MNYYPEVIQNLINEFNKLPGIGPKTSERFIFYLLKQPRSEIAKFSQALEHLRDKITYCEVCYNFSEKKLCSICSNKTRDNSTICVVAESSDLVAIEKTKEYKGLYHVLGGVINQIEGLGPEKLKIKELLERVKKNKIKEIIIATNPDMEGEFTALYLAKLLKPFRETKITRLGKGIPMGGNLEYADEITLSNALKGRREI